MKKEEIREKHLTLNGLSVNNSEVGKRIQKAAFDSMEEYAEEREQHTSIEFANFLMKENFKPRTIQDWCRYVNGDVEVFTTLELYDTFITSKQQSNG